MASMVFGNSASCYPAGSTSKKSSPQALVNLRISFLFYTFSFSYFKNIFAFLQMYIASMAATASTASEKIVNVIIFSFL